MTKKLIVFALMVFMLPSVVLAQSGNGDVDCNDDINILDIVYLINFKYKTGPEPCEIASAPPTRVAHFKYVPQQAIAATMNQWVNVGSITITAPASGKVILEGECHHSSVAETSFNLGFGTTPTDGDITFGEYSSSPFSVGVINHGQNLHEVVSVEEGPNTFYYNLYSIDTRYRYITMLTITATFIPDAIIVVGPKD